MTNHQIRNIIKQMKKAARKRSAPDTSLRHFGFKRDVLSTLPLRRDQLELFIGHDAEIRRLRDGVNSLENCALVGEPGSGKSSLMERLRAEIKREYQVVSIGVPVADGAYFLKELLQQLLVTLNRKLLKRVNFRSLSMELRREGDHLSKSKLKTMVVPLLTGYPKPLIIFVDDLEKIKSDVGLHLNRADATLVLLEEMKDVLEIENVCFVFSLQKEFYGHVERMMAGFGETTLLGLIKNIIRVRALSNDECYQLVAKRVTADKSGQASQGIFAESTLRFAVSRCEGNPRKLIFFLSEALYNAYRRGAKKVAFEDLFVFLNRFYRLDEVQKRILFYLSEKEPVSYDDPGLVASLSIDIKSIARRLAGLLGKGFLEAHFSRGAMKKEYFLKGRKPSEAAAEQAGSRGGDTKSEKTSIRYKIG